ncbi:MAG: glycosyltransferase family 2 protein [Bacteroidales bacterium]|nr:glycosyltransferase family 2 protein [Bacteroidales bacterium]
MILKNPVIVVVAFNRPNSLSRLLENLNTANYSQYTNVDVIISIDGGANTNVLKIAEEFQWNFGTKEIIYCKTNIGLKKHILQCGDLTRKFDSIILLEDDLVVSPEFYNYVTSALEFYKNEDYVAGIALYSYQYAETSFLPFQPIKDGFDNYFMQVPCSWGQAWTQKQWNKFRDVDEKELEINENDRIPVVVKEWSQNSWKKIFFKYLVLSSRFFVYPYDSFSSNYADTGTNASENNNFYQVRLVHSINRDFNFSTINQTISLYDQYFEFIITSKTKHLFPDGFDEKTIIDTFGTKQLEIFKGKKVLSTKPCNNPEISFSTSLLPIINNVIYKVQDGILSFSNKNDFNEQNDTQKYKLAKSISGIGFIHGINFQRNHFYYKIGYYLFFPASFLNRLLRKFVKNFKRKRKRILR